MDHKITRTWVRGNETLSATQTLTVDGETALDVSVAGSTTDQAVIWTCDVSQIKSLYILSTSKDVTFETNSSSSPADTISLKAGVPFIWTYGSGVTNPLGTDVTALYLTNAGAGATTVRLRIGYDA